jgi:hypothetical protein
VRQRRTGPTSTKTRTKYTVPSVGKGTGTLQPATARRAPGRCAVGGIQRHLRLQIADRFRREEHDPNEVIRSPRTDSEAKMDCRPRDRLGRANLSDMRIISAHVRAGAIVLDEQTHLPEGAAVTVLADTAEREFDVPQELEAELTAALEDANRGDVVPASAVLARLRG